MRLESHRSKSNDQYERWDAFEVERQLLAPIWYNFERVDDGGGTNARNYNFSRSDKKKQIGEEITIEVYLITKNNWEQFISFLIRARLSIMYYIRWVYVTRQQKPSGNLQR